MSRHPTRLSVLIAGALALAACNKPQDAVVPPGPQTQALDRAVESRLGGAETCVVLADAATGAIRYQYGRQAICMRRLPPCSTFKIANSLIGLDAGLVTPATVYRWDGTEQPVGAWERDADMRSAFRASIVWWFQKLAGQVGRERYAERLKAFGYGDARVEGPVTSFWLGPSAGGGLGISPREQVAFLHRFYTGALPVRPQSAAAVQGFMRDEDGPAGVEISGKTGSCASTADGARQAGWWVGRLKTAERDLVFAAAMDGPGSLPGAEIKARLEGVFADVGYLPAR